MASLGSFGTAVKELTAPSEPVTFLLGPSKELFYVESDLTFVPFGRLAVAGHAGLDTDVAEGAAAIMAMMRDMIGANPGEGKTKKARDESARTKDQEWIRFEESATRQKIDLDDMLAIIMAVLSGETGKAESRPTDSSNGHARTTTSPRSRSKRSNAGTEPVTPEMIAALGG
jgi:hypothetical protein